jgi:hypothetical protein
MHWARLSLQVWHSVQGDVPDTHPKVGLHISCPLQKFPSLHSGLLGMFWQTPALHISVVQSISSLQLALVVQVKVVA